MRIFLRNEMWVASKLIRYIIVSFLLVLCTERLMIMNGNSAFMTLFVCLVFGFAGETPLRFFLDDFLQDFMIAVKDKIMKWVKK